VDENGMKTLIKNVAIKYSSMARFKVSEEAIEALLMPTIPHLSDVTRELLNESISVDFLENGVLSILKNAEEFARQRRLNFIGSRDINLSMEKDCPYVFWC
jgi:hypothetical protein